MKKFLVSILLVLIIASSSFAVSNEVLNSMTLEQKVGQLFIIIPDALDTDLDLTEVDDPKAEGVKTVNERMLETLTKYPAGGFALFRKNIDTPEQLKKFTGELKNLSTIFPLMAVDEEGGLISRIANHKNFNVKKFKSVKQIAQSKKSREAGAVIGAYIKDYGFNLDFAPVADVNTNPENIVIGDRAFGNKPDFVSRNVKEFLDGLHSQNVAGCLKHFPGHGDTKGDTHENTVSVYKTWNELLKAEIIPFKENLDKADCVMTAHITMTNIDNKPATLSYELITEKLRKELKYDGVIITDAMKMKAIRNNYTSSEAAVLAIEAGNDIILMPYDYIEAFEGVLKAVKEGKISEERLNASVKRILNLKEKLNLKWWQKKAVYQIYPKSFLDTDGTGTGDIKGVTEKLDYLKSLDIGAIWLTPVYSSPMVDNGYDISDYKEINSMFGSMKDFDELLAEAKKRDIKIVMDLVFNHTSDQHEWFLESKKDKTNSKSDWYIWRDAKNGKEPTNWRSIFGGSAWTWNEDRKQYYLHTFAKEQPDLNWENPDVRRALYDIANFWLSKGVGGFRIDAIPYIKKPAEFLDGKPDAKDGTVNIHVMTANLPGILDFLHEFKHEVSEGKDIFTVGEANGVRPEDLKDWVGDKGVFDMIFEFSHVNLPFQNADFWCYSNEWKLTELKRALTASQNATKTNGWYPIFFENHDQPRSVNHFFPENADTKKAAKALAAVLMTLRGTPFIYQGQELGMTNVTWNNIKDYDDISSRGQYDFAINEGFSPDEAMKFIRYFSRDNARTPMQWNNKANAGFSPKNVKTWLPVNENYLEINAEEEEENSASVLAFYRKLNEIRKTHEALIYGDYKEIFSDSEEIFAFERSFNGEQITTIVNFSLKPVKVPSRIWRKKLILTSEKDFNKKELKPLEARIYKVGVRN